MPGGLPNLFDYLRTPEKFFGRDRCEGIWRGVVEDADDPEQRGRLRVRVFNRHAASIPVEHLPWAEQRYDDAGPNYGEFHSPYSVGSVVWIIFEQADPNYPVVVGSWYAAPGGESEVPEECRTAGYPKRRIWKTKEGHKIEMSDEPGEFEIKITDSAGNYIHLDTEEGLLDIYWNGDKQLVVTGDADLTVQGDVDLTVGGDTTAKFEGDVQGTIEGNTDLTAKGAVDITCEQNVGATIQGNLTAQVTGATNLTCAGAVVANVNAAATFNFSSTATLKATGPMLVEGNPLTLKGIAGSITL